MATVERQHTKEHKHTNNLIRATSPYLLQHAHNPVDWHEWGDEALTKARTEDKPIFLSIGYSACHWCHVMEHESFESEEVAALLNDNFVCIKVDREERPDIDEIYMAYTQAVTGGGGWPMSVWLSPDGAPFHAGTYFPKDRFVQILDRLAYLWRNDRDQLLSHTDSVRGFFAEWETGPGPAPGVLPQSRLDNLATTLSQYFDRSLGGMRSRGNKFPPSMAMDLLLRVHRRTGNGDLLDAVDVTLDHMGRGGIYDHIGGGICRYSTDPKWLVPHFEKMLYDQGLVSGVYLDAYQATGNTFYAFIAGDILNYVIQDLQSPEGGIYSSRDADSDGLEGAFYIWTVEQVSAVLGEDEAKLFCEYFDVTLRGNWFESRGHAPAGPKNVLNVPTPRRDFAKAHGLDEHDLANRVASWRAKLKPVRSKRVPPALDDKILAGWNGLIIASLAKGGVVLNERNYVNAAERAAAFVLGKMRTPDGRLLRSHRKGTSRLTGYLSDYAFFVEGLLNLYEATFERKWLDAALELTDTSIRYYDDNKGGAFFFTAADAEALLARSKSPHDGAIPAGNSVHALNLLRLAVLFDRKDLRKKAESIFRAFGPRIEQSPGAFERLCCAIDFYHDTVKEIAVVGDPALPETQALLRTVRERYLPNKVVVGATGPVDESPVALLRRKKLKDGKPTAYVCENYNCKMPVTTPADLAKQLEVRQH